MKYRNSWTVFLFHFHLTLLIGHQVSVCKLSTAEKENLKWAFIKKTQSSPQSLPPRPLPGGLQQPRWLPDVKYIVTTRFQLILPVDSQKPPNIMYV